MANVKVCRMPGCSSKDILARGLCRKCYNFARYWQGRSAADLLDRAETLRFWEGRMDSLLPQRLTRITRKRRRA